MLGLRTTLVTAAVPALFAVPVLAQGRPLPPQPPPTRAQQGTAGPAIPPVPPPAATVAPQSNYPNSYGPTVLSTAVPVTVASDGRVYANFGFGFTLVPQQCSAQRLRHLGLRSAPAQRQPRVQQPVPQGTTTGPTANDASASQQASSLCWTRVQNGMVVVYH